MFIPSTYSASKLSSWSIWLNPSGEILQNYALDLGRVEKEHELVVVRLEDG